MNITGIIAEYNPLHLGHQFHIDRTRALTAADNASYTITILSGDFVQRGLPALLDKHTRTRLALEAGSDLVLELPTPYALSSGEGFGFGGVSLLQGLGCVTHLSFGTEEGSLHTLMQLAKALTAESPEYQRAYQITLKKGLPHPAARLEALKIICPTLDLSVLDGQSNNMLALEYCKALCRLDSDIQPLTIKRMGQNYLESEISTAQNKNALPTEAMEAFTADEVPAFPSATAVRKALNKNTLSAELKEFVPAFTASALQAAQSQNNLVYPDDFSNLLHYKLLSLSPEELSAFWEVTPDFANKIAKNLPYYESFTQFTNLLWTKDTTYARVCRTLMHILLDIKEKTWDIHQPVPYARVLGFRKNSAGLLTELKKKSSLPLITKLADAEKLLTPKAYELLKLDIKAAHIYDSVVLQKSGVKAKHEMQKQIVIL